MFENSINGKTKIFAVIGCPIEHTISPQLHNTISCELGLNYIYVPFMVAPESLEIAVQGLRALNVAGFNVTIPFKQSIMPLLDEIDRTARLIGAVNTVKNDRGRLCGYNTDADGFVHAFKEETKTDFKDKKVVLLGAGGAARALAIKIASKGASNIVIINRTAEKANQIVQSINQHINHVAQVAILNSEESRVFFAESDIIINTIPIGMYPDTGKCPVDGRYGFRRGQIVYDAIYNPPKTELLLRAEQNGCIAVNGLGWLFYQGVFAYEIWTGIKLDSGVIAKVFNKFTNLTGNY